MRAICLGVNAQGLSVFVRLSVHFRFMAAGLSNSLAVFFAQLHVFQKTVLSTQLKTVAFYTPYTSKADKARADPTNPDIAVGHPRCVS